MFKTPYFPLILILFALFGPVFPVNAGEANANRQEIIDTFLESMPRSKGTDSSLHCDSCSLGRHRLELPDPTVVSIHHSGHQCVRRDTIRIWRAQAADPKEAWLKFDRKRAKISWKTDQHIINIPAKYVPDGAEIRIDSFDINNPVITLHYIPDEMTDPDEVLLWMIRQECNVQALVMLGM